MMKLKWDLQDDGKNAKRSIAWGCGRRYQINQYPALNEFSVWIGYEFVAKAKTLDAAKQCCEDIAGAIETAEK
jgi:hypothetical protein